MDRWAQTVYAEGTTGHVCASCQTILAWNMGSTQAAPADCRRLVILNFGYAYADKVPCVAGGQALEHTGAWLTTEEWGIFDTWLPIAYSQPRRKVILAVPVPFRP